MRKVFKVATAGVTTLSLLAGCGSIEPTIEQPGSIVGFAQGIDSQLWGDVWVDHVNEDNLPSDGVREIKVNPRGRRVGCVAVGDGYFSVDTDDEGCGGFWGDGSRCGADENEHCKAVFAPTYDFQQLTPQVLQDCRAELKKTEFKPEKPVTNERCKNNRKDGQWVINTPRFLIWLSTTNPDYDKEHPEKADPYITGVQQINDAEWERAERTIQTTVVIRSGKVIDVKLD